MTLKLRVIPVLLFRSPTLVKGSKFDNWRTVGNPVQATRVFNLRNVDELIFLDIAATIEDKAPDLDLVNDISDQCFMPLTIGGGIRSLEHIEGLLKNGADKVSINSSATSSLEFVRQAAYHFGSQCIVVSIDAHASNERGKYHLMSRCGTERVDEPLDDYARRVEDSGAGEILLTSVDRDGSMIGYDLELIGSFAPQRRIPVIVAGGAGNEQHVVDVAGIEGVRAVAAGSMFFFTEVTPHSVKICLEKAGIPVRET